MALPDRYAWERRIPNQRLAPARRSSPVRRSCRLVLPGTALLSGIAGSWWALQRETFVSPPGHGPAHSIDMLTPAERVYILEDLELDRRSLLSSAVGSVIFGGAAAEAKPLKTSSVVSRVRANGSDDEVVTLASGVKFVELQEGRGDVPQMGDSVVVHVKGYLREPGDPLFMDTYKDGGPRGKPISFSLGVQPEGITDGLQEGIASMRYGGQRIVEVPYEMGYPQGVARAYAKPPLRGPIPLRTDLLYEVELLRCNDWGIDGRTMTICCSDKAYPCNPPMQLRAADNSTLQTKAYV
eukprot:TRINITY_DN1787_c0_g1_i1.p1 TRINITY_DN1787_c0_g1~~TRINITY_DN1787_c0_g1_i1.p1  ORF type:complete len:296 (-),score=43.04 TRINITY_DN1787_c0_g1_i1:111-998(-)